MYCQKTVLCWTHGKSVGFEKTFVSCTDSFNTRLVGHCFLRAEGEISVSSHFVAYVIPYTSKTDLLGRVELHWVEPWLDF
jgi:hypothetical protein